MKIVKRFHTYALFRSRRVVAVGQFRIPMSSYLMKPIVTLKIVSWVRPKPIAFVHGHHGNCIRFSR